MNSTKGKIWIFERNNYIWSLKQTFEPDDSGSYFGLVNHLILITIFLLLVLMQLKIVICLCKIWFWYKHLTTLSGASGTEYAENVTIYNDLIVVGLKKVVVLKVVYIFIN